MEKWQADLLIDHTCELGEGPLWHPIDQKLYWVDILSKQLHRYDPSSKRHETRDFPMIISALSPTKDGQLVIATEENVIQYHFDQRISLELIKLESRIVTNRTNDGKAGPTGIFWIGTMSKEAKPGFGTLYALKPDLSIEPVVENTTISNGLTWSMDHKTMYYIDSPDNVVYAFDFDASNGRISNKRVIIDFSKLPGVPDGMTIDTEGMLWIAHWGGFKVGRWDPNTGEQIGLVELPVPRVTCCTFGGPNLSTLYITTAWEHMNAAERAEHPMSGALFQVELPYKGMESYYFKK